MPKTKDVVVRNPDSGLLTYVPPDLSDGQAGKHIVVGENVRAEFGVLKAAPGYERVHIKEGNLDSPANLIFQAQIVATDVESRSLPVIGTEKNLYAVRRRSRELICSDCSTSFAVLGDSGRLVPDGGGRIPLKDVADLITRLAPDCIIHTGDLVYADGGAPADTNRYEAYVAQFFYPWIGGYRGMFGEGPAVGRFFPAMGNHDWDEGPANRFFSAFLLPPPERYYTIKRGAVQFFFLNSYGYGPASTGPGGTAMNGTGAADGVGEANLSWADSPQAVWLRAAVAASDTTWRVVVFHHPSDTSQTGYSPGYAIMDWPWQEIGVDLVLNGHAHVYERIVKNGVTRVICGTGGASLRTFTTPVAGSEVRHTGDYGAMYVTADRQTLTSRYYTRDGVVRDTFTLTAQRASDKCYIGDYAKRPQSLEVVPEAISTEVGGKYQLLAYLFYTDGSREDVTSKAAWTSSDQSVATVQVGEVSGVKGGSATVTAAYSGVSDTCAVEVLVACVDEPVDVALVLDLSYSMWEMSGSARRIDRLKQSADLLLGALSRGPGDRVAGFSFSGDFANQIPDTRMLSALGDPVEKLRARVQELTPYGSTGIADAVRAATRELSGPRHVKGRRQVLILFTDGYANVSTEAVGQPENSRWDIGMAASTAAATEAKAKGITVMVVGLDIGIEPAREAVVASWASNGLYYAAESADDLLGIFSNLLGDLCRDGYYYQTTTPLSVGTDLLYA